MTLTLSTERDFSVTEILFCVRSKPKDDVQYPGARADDYTTNLNTSDNNLFPEKNGMVSIGECANLKMATTEVLNVGIR
jgi:hypothetical protein